MKNIKIKDKIIGDERPVFIVAEAANNHGGDFEIAKQMIVEAANFGADAVKLQCLFLDEFAVKNHPYYEVYKKLEFSEEQWTEIRNLALERDILFFVDVLCPKAVELMERLKVDMIKIHCGDITNYELLKQAAKTKIPLGLHTGYANLNEIKTAIDILKNNGCEDLIIMYGFQDYPTKMSQLNLNALKKLKEMFDLNICFMDHTDGIIAPVLALGFGITMLEKHFSLDRKARRYDYESSIDPPDFKKMIEIIRDCESAYGNGNFAPTKEEQKHLPSVRKFIVAERNINAGEIINGAMIGVKRTGTVGLESSQIERIVGKKAIKDIVRDQTITEEMVVR